MMGGASNSLVRDQESSKLEIRVPALSSMNYDSVQMIRYFGLGSTPMAIDYARFSAIEKVVWKAVPKISNFLNLISCPFMEMDC